MSCFLRERNTVEGMNPVKVYIMNNKKHVAKYDGEVKVSHSVFNTLHPVFQASILKRKADRERLKEEKEQKHETPAEAPVPKPSKRDRLSALANIHDMHTIGQFLYKNEARAVAGTSKNIAEKVHNLPKEITPTKKYSKEDIKYALIDLGFLLFREVYPQPPGVKLLRNPHYLFDIKSMKEGSYKTFSVMSRSYTVEKKQISIIEMEDQSQEMVGWQERLEPLIGTRYIVGGRPEQTGNYDDRMEEIKTDNKRITGGWVTVLPDYKLLVAVDLDKKFNNYRELSRWLNHFALVCHRNYESLAPMPFNMENVSF